MPEEGASEGEGDGAKILEMAHMGATMAIGMLGATVKLGNFLPRAVAGTPTRNIFHFPIGGTFVAPPMNKGHAFMGSLNVLADDDPLSGGGGTPSYGLLGYRYPHSAPEQEECGVCGIVPTHRRYHPYPLGKAYPYQSYPDAYQSRGST